MSTYVKPFHLVKGHNYKIGYGEDTKTVYRLIKASKTGYKFLNLRTNTCGRQQIMYPSKESNHTKNNETWFWLPANMVITEIPLADMEIGICNTCNQMTNHRDGMCLKCAPTEENVPDFYEAKEHQNYKLLPRQAIELRTYKHQDLMKELNDMMIRIKRHLFKIPGDTIMPENEELDALTNKLMTVLREDSEPMIKH
jgi:hypothetical protein